MFKWPWVKTPRIVIPALTREAAPVKVELPFIAAEAVKPDVDAPHDDQMTKMWPINHELDEMINSLKPIKFITDPDFNIDEVRGQKHTFILGSPIPLSQLTATQPQLNKNSITMSQTFLQRIETGVQNFLNNVEKKLPTVLEEGAEFGLKYTALFQSWIDSGAVTDITTLVPATEPLKVEIDAILAQLKTAFTAIDSAFAKGTLFIAAGKIGQLQTGVDVPLSHVLLAVQAKYDTKTA